MLQGQRHTKQIPVYVKVRVGFKSTYGARFRTEMSLKSVGGISVGKVSIAHHVKHLVGAMIKSLHLGDF